ncbi:MAG: hypothetical protein ACI9PY_002375 [Ascidiaceihabitans sp.]|jgi:hypothetical protein
MARNVILFGNGLGRAIDNDFYSIKRVLQSSWDNEAVLNEQQRRLICDCLPQELIEGELKAPTSEPELSNLQKVMDACDTIREFENEDANEQWLSQHGSSFPIAIRRYFHHAASLFHQGDKCLPEDFAKPLRQFIYNSGPDIVTLNYDDLLYEAFSGTPVFAKHFLRDGFFGGKLDFARQEGYFNANREGWFLHLHGSPLFVTREGEPRKITRDRLGEYAGENSFHIVLTNADSKPSVIENSSILSQYWGKLGGLLRDAKSITLFGYGGGDTHLNNLIGLNDAAHIRIICRSDENTEAQLKTKWRNLLRAADEQSTEIVMLEKLTDFDDW